MKLIIHIPEDLLENIKEDNCSMRDMQTLLRIIKNGIPLEEIRQIRPCMREPEQEGHEEYNKGWNDAIKEYLCNIDNFKEMNNDT